MKYAHYDSMTYKLIGWYSNDLHDVIPTPNIEVTNEEWQTAIDANANFVDVLTNTVTNKDLRTDVEKLEYVKTVKLEQIQEDFTTAEETPIPFSVNSTEYVFYGGEDSVTSIDKYVRLAQLAGQTEFTIWDTFGIDHILTLEEVNNLIITIGYQAHSNKVTKKNRKLAVTLATTIAEVEAC